MQFFCAKKPQHLLWLVLFSKGNQCGILKYMEETVAQETANNPLSVFWLSVDKIDPNPFQPRKEFADDKLQDLAQSIRRYGVLQPLVVTKKEAVADTGDMSARYELIAGERRLRASKIAGLSEVPAVVRVDVTEDNVRLELAMIENLERDDLNPIDRARAFKQLIEEFKMTHTEVAQRMSRSREYISNSLRLLTLPEDMIQAVTDRKISEGHTRPLLMLVETPDDQRALFDEIVNRRITVRDSEIIARRQAKNRARKIEHDPYLERAQTMLEGFLETRVSIRSQGETGGRIVIDYFSGEDLESIVGKLEGASDAEQGPVVTDTGIPVSFEEESADTVREGETESTEDEMYNFKNFSL